MLFRILQEFFEIFLNFFKETPVSLKSAHSSRMFAKPSIPERKTRLVPVLSAFGGAISAPAKNILHFKPFRAKMKTTNHAGGTP